MSIIEVCGGILGAAAAEERAPLPPRWRASPPWRWGATERIGGTGACLVERAPLQSASDIEQANVVQVNLLPLLLLVFLAVFVIIPLYGTV